MLSRKGVRAGVPALLLGSGVACGSPPPSAAPTQPFPAPIAVEAKEKAFDTSAVPEPAGLIVLARVSRPESIVSAVGSWTSLRVPKGDDLVRVIADDGVADVADLAQPVDGAVSLTMGRAGPEPLFAFSVAVKGLEQAKVKLGERHRLVARANGQYLIEGIGRPSGEARPSLDGHGDPEDEDLSCVLAPAAVSSKSDLGATPAARLVCGSTAGLEALVPYLTRTLPRERWPSDVHIEVRPEPARAPVSELRASLPVLVRSLMGSSSPAVYELVDASLGELLDIVNDVQKVSFDGQMSDSGVEVTSRFDFQSTKSVFARAMTVADRADSPPQAFWHLPGDADTAFFTRGADPKLFERPRELLAKILIEATGASGLPEGERNRVRDLVADRMVGLFANGGTAIYAKGFDEAAVQKVLKAKASLGADDAARRAEAWRAVLEQVVGWHLYQLSEPVAKVGPMLKDWAALWSRPAFAKWAQSRATNSALPRMRIAPAPAGVTLPKESVHLEIVVPREEERMVSSSPSAPLMTAGRGSGTQAAAARAAAEKQKKTDRGPLVFHVFAVPDGSATWLAFGLDAKLVAQKAASTLASAPDTSSLGKLSGRDVLGEAKINGGGMATLRGLIVFSALEAQGERSPFALLGSLPNRGATPVVFTGRAEPSSGTASGGSATGTLRVSRAVIQDFVKLVMSAR